MPQKSPTKEPYYQVGYPAGWPTLARYGTLDLTDASLYENIVTVAKAHSQQERDRCGKRALQRPKEHYKRAWQRLNEPCKRRIHCPLTQERVPQAVCV